MNTQETLGSPDSIEESEIMNTYYSVTQPATFKTNLYPHQLKAISLLEEKEREQKIVVASNSELRQPIRQNNIHINTNVAMYSDITGYGKTAAIIGMLIRDKMPWDKSELYIHNAYITHYGEGRILATELVKYEKINTNLILVNQSLVKQWEDELSASNLKYCSITTKKQVISCEAHNYDVILITPNMYNSLMAHHNGHQPFPFAWKRFIFDEPQNTHISSMKPIMAGFNWFVTATPHMMLNKSRNRNSFITNIFYFGLHRPIFDALIVRNNDDFVRQSYCLPETFHKHYDTYQPLYNIVKGLANDTITQMIAADNIIGAIKLLGGQASNLVESDESSNNIFDLLRKRKSDELLEITMKISLYTTLNDLNKKTKWEDKKRCIDQQLVHLNQRILEISSNQCAICTDICSKPVMVGGCCHVFCGACILTWLKERASCPNCRHTTSTKELIYINNNNTNPVLNDQPAVDSSTQYTKQQMVIKLIKETKGGKIIIYSAFSETFINIRYCLEKENILFSEILGKKESRDKTIHEFKYGLLNVLFLNSLNTGDGINLQEASDIILYHSMSDDLQTQIIGRANRIGRKINLRVHHLN